jgi:hypothetical protein
MMQRILIGFGLLALGFYVGREVGRTEAIRRQMQTEREHRERLEGESTSTAAEAPEQSGA